MPLIVSAEELAKTDETTVDFVLLLDCTGSMDTNDKDKLAEKAAKMFIDMLPAENARLSVILFGQHYGDKAYKNEFYLEDGQVYGRDCVKQIYPLVSITEIEEKSSAKNAIEQEIPYKKGNSQTTIGFALQAALDVLVSGGAEKDSAAIILMTDGECNGQGNMDRDTGNHDGKDFITINDAVSNAKEMEWPIYTLELDYDKTHQAGGGDDGIAYHLMREVIAPGSGGTNTILQSASQAQNAFADIFAKFFDAEPTYASGTIQNGEVSLDFEIGEMVAETNLTITGRVDEITSIDVVDCNGETQTIKNGDENASDRIVTFGDQYITIRLMAPEEGSWKIVAHGTDGVEIGLYAVSIREMNLKLNADISDADIISKGTSVNFTANFTYHGNDYPASKFYSKQPASLVIHETGERIPMIGGSDCYYLEEPITFEKEGTYTITAVVSSDIFRSGVKESGTYTYEVRNKAPYVVKELGTIDLGINKELEIDCNDYITDDDDELSYSVEITPEDGKLQYSLSGSKLTLQSALDIGSYSGVLKASDGANESKEMTFSVSIVNQPLELVEGHADGDTVFVNFTFNAQKLPGFIKKLVNIPEDNEINVCWDDYFVDPDGVDPVINIVENETSDAVLLEKQPGGLHIEGKGKGKGSYSVTATDASDSSISYTMTFQIASYDAWSLVWKILSGYIIAGVALLVFILGFVIYANTGKKIYGTWDIVTSMKTVQNRRLSITSAGKRSECTLGKLMKDLQLMGDFDSVKLKAGNRISKNVKIFGFGKMQRVTVNGNSITDPNKLKSYSVSLTKGKSIELLNMSGERIKLVRKK